MLRLAKSHLLKYFENKVDKTRFYYVLDPHILNYRKISVRQTNGPQITPSWINYNTCLVIKRGMSQMVKFRQLTRRKKVKCSFESYGSRLRLDVYKTYIVVSFDNWLIENWSSTDSYNSKLRQLIKWFCVIVHRWKTFSLISSRDHCHS